MAKNKQGQRPARMMTERRPKRVHGRPADGFDKFLRWCMPKQFMPVAGLYPYSKVVAERRNRRPSRRDEPAEALREVDAQLALA